MTKVSFDFDSTLLRRVWDEDNGFIPDGPNRHVLDMMLRIHLDGSEVLIVTSRYECKEGEDLYCGDEVFVKDFVEKFQLPVSGIHFTNGHPKAETLVALGVSEHWDDDIEELAVLPSHIDGVLVEID